MDLYKILGVAKDATPDQIKKAYRKMAIKHHPDKGGDENEFKALVVAYTVLSDEDKRRRYDNGESVESVSQNTPIEQQAFKLLMETFISFVNAVPDTSKFDIFQKIKEHVNHMTTHMNVALNELAARIDKYEKTKKRIKSKDENNMFVMGLDNEIASTNRSIKKVKEQQEVAKIAVKILEDYGYDFEQAVQIKASGDGLRHVTFTTGGG